jgi:hypothetical protein
MSPCAPPARAPLEVLAVEAVELVPGAECAGIRHPVHEQDAVEVVELVLEGAGGQAAAHLLVLDAVAVEVAHAHVHVPRHLAPQVRHRQAALVDLLDVVVERLDHRVHDHGQRDGRLVRVARVALPHLHDRDPERLGHLVRREPGPVRPAHGLDHVVDQALDRVGAQLLRGHLAGTLAQDRMADLDDPTNAHPSRSSIGMRTPRSSATSVARSYPASA